MGLRDLPSLTSPRFGNLSLFAELGPLSESLLKPSPQHVCLTLWISSKVLLKFTLYLVPGTFHFELVHGELDT